MKNKLYRHGDLLLENLTEFPPKRLVKSFVEEESAILLHGEVTGHSHRIMGSFEILRATEDNSAYLKVLSEGAYLIHEEHARIDLPEGKYAVVRQREYTPNAIVYVRD